MKAKLFSIVYEKLRRKFYPRSNDYTQFVTDMYYAPEPTETSTRSFRMKQALEASKRTKRPAGEALPEPMETSTRSVRPSKKDASAHENSQFDLLAVPSTATPALRNSHRGGSTPLTSSNLSAMLASLPQPVSSTRYSNRVSPQSLSHCDLQGQESSACPSLSTSPGSTSSSTLSFANAPEGFQPSTHGIPTFELADCGEKDGSASDVKEVNVNTLVASPTQPRDFPISEARVSVNDSEIMTNNSKECGSRGLEDLTTPESHPTQPKNILIPASSVIKSQPPLDSVDNLPVKKDCPFDSKSSSPSPSEASSTNARLESSSENMSVSSCSSVSSTNTALTVACLWTPPSSKQKETQSPQIWTSKISKIPPPSPPALQSPSSPPTLSSSSSSLWFPSASECGITADSSKSEFLTEEPASLCPMNPSEVSDRFVEMVYRYLSFKHNCMARQYDFELAEITGISVEDVRSDRFTALKSYVEKYIEKHPGIRSGQGW